MNNAISEILSQFKRKEFLIFFSLFIFLLIFAVSANIIKYNVHLFFFVFFLLLSIMICFWNLFLFKVWFKQEKYSLHDIYQYYRQKVLLAENINTTFFRKVFFRIPFGSIKQLLLCF